MPRSLLSVAVLAAALNATAVAVGVPGLGAQSAPAAPAANPADVASLDAIIGALYASISGPKGQPRDFDRMRSLMGPNARLIPTGRDPAGKATLRNLSVDEYIALAGPALMRDGFFEREIGRTMSRYGNVVHIMSAYDSKRTPDAEPFSRGINSIQLFDDGTRWWILSIMWDSERPDNPIPASMLKSGH